MNYQPTKDEYVTLLSRTNEPLGAARILAVDSTHMLLCFDNGKVRAEAIARCIMIDAKSDITKEAKPKKESKAKNA